jgi:hypothetical protein
LSSDKAARATQRRSCGALELLTECLDIILVFFEADLPLGHLPIQARLKPGLIDPNDLSRRYAGDVAEKGAGAFWPRIAKKESERSWIQSLLNLRQRVEALSHRREGNKALPNMVVKRARPSIVSR